MHRNFEIIAHFSISVQALAVWLEYNELGQIIGKS
jgi:hypothetical protein